ncbi:hypothetical protein Tco_0451215 [Tanacetum coccineum]
MGHNDEIVLARVRTSTLEILIEDIQCMTHSLCNPDYYGSLPIRFSQDLWTLIMDMINDQDIEHTISPTPSPNYPLISYLSGRGMKPLRSESVPEKPNELDAC